jgi:hypothetical protein
MIAVQVSLFQYRSEVSDFAGTLIRREIIISMGIANNSAFTST